MRRGHAYRQILPQNLLVNGDRFRGFPFRWTMYGTIVLGPFAEFPFTLADGPLPTVDLHTCSVEYAGRATAGLQTIGVKLIFSLKNHEPFNHVLFSALDDLGNSIVGEAQRDVGSDFGTFEPNLTVISPWDRIAFRGVWTNLGDVSIQPIYYFQEPGLNRGIEGSSP